ncbi:DUF2125 domain-containing protein [Paracoccus zeaxanthinifaciens]|uniref:DUF2125 domain-containing protein n=1 Tax=Paracoccus zeaxanthinifaciens TaxID=187400 RepID=UPI0003B34B27|nr:DUF2125 domain-containing protein [Paracoccus zeaxanthinifaciens]
MLKGLAGIALLIGAGAATWIGTEGHVAGRLRAAMQDAPDLRAETVTPLRDPRAWGIRIEGPEWGGPAGGIAVDWAQVSVAPLDPFRVVLGLPGDATLTLAGRDIPLRMEAPAASVDFAPLRRMAPARIVAGTGAITSNELPMLGDAQVSAELVQVDIAAPLDTLAAYDVDLAIEGLQPAALATLGALVPEDALDLVGAAQVWLDGTPGPLAQAAPRLTGLRTEGLVLRMGQAEARLLGQVAADAQGRAAGQLAVYTADADASLDQAAALGLIEGPARLLLGAGLRNIAAGDVQTEFPEAQGDEIRLILGFEDGRITIGGMPVGPAPILR